MYPIKLNIKSNISRNRSISITDIKTITITSYKTISPDENL